MLCIARAKKKKSVIIKLLNKRSPEFLSPSLSGYQCVEDGSPGGGCILEDADFFLALASACVHSSHFYSAHKYRS